MKNRYLCRMCGKATGEKNSAFVDYGGATKKIGVLCLDCYDQIGQMYAQEHNYHRENPKAG